MTEPPPEIAAYFVAVATGDVDLLADCFTADAEVIDVDRPIEGREAIDRWAAEEVIGGTYTLHEVTPRADGADVLLTFAPPGEATGFRARYAVTLADGKIARMVLRYA
jgi:ketosteroid isomerase-like protein